MSAEPAAANISGLKHVAEQTLTARQEFGRSQESWDQRQELEQQVLDYLVDSGYDETHAERQASEIAVDAVIGDIDEAKLKLDALHVLNSEFSHFPAEPVKQAALEFYEVQKEHERSSQVYRDSRENLQNTALHYFESHCDLECSKKQAGRITTEVALGEGHIYDAIEKLNAIEAMRINYAEEN